MPTRRTGRRDGPTYDQLQEAMDIFGAGYDDFSDEEEGAGFGGDADSVGEGGATGEAAEQRRIQKLRARFERAHLVATFCTDRDEELRRVDRPERMQQMLVGRDTPSEGERQLEARWMASKLAARMIADRHLDSSRQTVPQVANPQAAFESDLYSYHSEADKEERLRKELQGPIVQVLKFLQVRTGTNSSSDGGCRSKLFS